MVTSNFNFKPKKHTTEHASKKMTSIISDNENTKTKYMCNNCINSQLGQVEEGLWLCPQCKVTFAPRSQKVRKGTDFYVPTKKVDYNTEALAYSIDYNQDVGIHKEPDYQGGIKALKDKGLKITSYTVTDGAGRPLKNRDRDEEW